MCQSLSFIDLQIENPCWFYEGQSPVLVCAAHSMELPITWRLGWQHIAIGGTIVDNGMLASNLSSYAIQNNTRRQEILQLSSDITTYALAVDYEFSCEQKGYQSQFLPLHIPGNLCSIVVRWWLVTFPVNSYQ